MVGICDKLLQLLTQKEIEYREWGAPGIIRGSEEATCVPSDSQPGLPAVANPVPRIRRTAAGAAEVKNAARVQAATSLSRKSAAASCVRVPKTTPGTVTLRRLPPTLPGVVLNSCGSFRSSVRTQSTVGKAKRHLG